MSRRDETTDLVRHVASGGPTFDTVYVDEGVQAPDGSEYTVEAFLANRHGPGSTGSILSFLVSLARGESRKWRVRVRPWPAKMFASSWTALVASEQDALNLCTKLQELLETGSWKPGVGEPPTDR